MNDGLKREFDDIHRKNRPGIGGPYWSPIASNTFATGIIAATGAASSPIVGFEISDDSLFIHITPR